MTLTAESLRRQARIVLQDTFLFSDTVLANIRVGKPDATDAEVRDRPPDSRPTTSSSAYPRAATPHWRSGAMA